MSLLRVEFQLTYDEFLEALLFARKRLVREMKRRSRAEFWIGMVVLVVLIAVVLDRLLDFFLPNSRTVQSVPWQVAVRPYFWLMAVIWLGLFGFRLLQQRRVRIINRLAWEGRPQLHQIRTADLSEASVIFSDRFARTEYQWSIFHSLQETQNTFMLYISEYSGAYEIIPKRALMPAGKMDRFRALVEQNIQQQVAAFPVVPIPTANPLPPPPLQP